MGVQHIPGGRTEMGVTGTGEDLEDPYCTLQYVKVVHYVRLARAPIIGRRRTGVSSFPRAVTKKVETRGKWEDNRIKAAS